MGTLIIVCGRPGAGKSTYAAALALKRRASRLNIDAVGSHLASSALTACGRDPDDRDSSFYKQHFRSALYESLFALAEENLPVHDVIIEGPFTRELRDPAWRDQLELRFKSPVEIHYLWCDSSIRRQRLELRGSPRDKAKLANWQQHLEYYGPDQAPACPHVFIDTSKSQ